jgi:hypothetical protein
MTCYCPLQVSLSGKSLTQELSSKFLPTQLGILCRVMRRTIVRLLFDGAAVIHVSCRLGWRSGTRRRRDIHWIAFCGRLRLSRFVARSVFFIAITCRDIVWRVIHRRINHLRFCGWLRRRGINPLRVALIRGLWFLCDRDAPLERLYFVRIVLGQRFSFSCAGLLRA